MRIAICGGRERHPLVTREQIISDLTSLCATAVIHGNCRGTDRFVAQIAKSMGLTTESHPANWKLHGRAAGPIHNQIMASRCEIAIAYPGGKGTASMIRLIRSMGKRVYEPLFYEVT